MKSFLAKSLPQNVRQAGWWTGAARDGAGDGVTEPGPPIRLVLLAALIAASDVLIWQVAPGVSLALFGLLCVGSAILTVAPGVPRRRIALAGGLAVLSVLPVIELVQPLSVMFFLAGLPVALSVLAGRRIGGALRYWWAGPWHSLKDAVSAPSCLSDGPTFLRVLGRAGTAWTVPIAVGGLFALLLVQANPVFEGWFLRLPDLRIDLPGAGRMSLWVAIGLLVWPALSLPRFAARLSPDPRPRRAVQVPGIVNGAAILRSLVLFNGLFALQNGMDLLFLTSGVRLPDGMTYAEYAHRGAYPLVALALLAGLFALICRPFVIGRPALRALLLIWVAQTIWLTFSSALRLELYVETYGLTRLRLSAAIWLAMVATGLGMILWQIGRGHDNRWLIGRVAALGFGVLYICSFVSFDARIAQYQLTHDVPEDRFYLCSLGEAVVPVILRETGRRADRYCTTSWPVPSVSVPRDWREWGFRNARVRRSLAEIQAGEMP